MWQGKPRGLPRRGIRVLAELSGQRLWETQTLQGAIVGGGVRLRLAVPDTHSSETVYLSARGSQATLPIHTPWATSLNRRPRFLPRMVSKVPPSKGPLRGSICQGTRASEGLRPGAPLSYVPIKGHRPSRGQGASEGSEDWDN